MKGNLEVAVCRYIREVVESRFLKIEAEFLGGRTQPQLPAAFDVGSGKRFAIVPFHVVAQLQGQLGPVLAPCPAGRQIGHDRLQADLFFVLVEHDQVVEHPHHRHLSADRRLLEKR
jgi:hypothetical protein